MIIIRVAHRKIYTYSKEPIIPLLYIFQKANEHEFILSSHNNSIPLRSKRSGKTLFTDQFI